MENHAIHGHDVSSFDLPATHRLPTVSAAQAYDELADDPSRWISTSIPPLDQALAGGVRLNDTGAAFAGPGGIQRGQLTEIWGPPGSGKTAFGMQLAANAIRNDHAVVWVDALHPLCKRRFASISEAHRGTDRSQKRGGDASLHYTCPSLAHLIALLCRPTELCLTKTTALVIIDGLSALINHALPRSLHGHTQPNSVRRDKDSTPSARRTQVLQYIVTALQKLGAANDLAVVILTQCATRMHSAGGASLVPALNASVWEQGISTRLVLFHEWGRVTEEPVGMHFVGIQKLDGRNFASGITSLSAFEIQESGLRAVALDATQTPADVTPTPNPKRKLDETQFEIADSEDEDFGWNDDDDTAMPPNPSQWQGSEDLILGPQPNESESEGEDHDGQAADGSADEESEDEEG